VAQLPDYSRPRAALPLQMNLRGRWNRLFPRGQRLQPERRSGFRIVTLKNAGWLALSLTVLFLIFSAYMERRSSGTSNYGRLFDRRIEATRPVTPQAKPEVVTEAPERPVERRDVLLNRQEEEPAATATTAPPAPPARKPIRPRRGDERVVITGGSEGVRADIQPAPPAATTTEP
jgi:hypothetical protein